MTDHDRQLIEAHIAQRGVTHCPTAFADVSSASVDRDDAQAHKKRGLDPVGDAWRAKHRPARKGPKRTRRKAVPIKAVPANAAPSGAETVPMAQFEGLELNAIQMRILSAIAGAGEISQNDLAKIVWRARPVDWRRGLIRHISTLRKPLTAIGWTIPSASGHREGETVYRLKRIEP